MSSEPEEDVDDRGDASGASDAPDAPDATDPPREDRRVRTLDRRAAPYLRRLVGRHASVAAEALRQLKRGDDPETLHRYRVSIRRIRSLVREVARVLPDVKIRKRDLNELRDLATQTNAGRDRDVHRIWLMKVLQRPRGQTLRRGLEALARPTCQQNLQATGIDPVDLRRRLKRVSERIDARLRCDDQLSAREAFAGMLRHERDRFAERMALAFGGGTLDDMHAARLAAKRLRYMLEPLQSRGVKATSAVKAMRRLQDDFGSLNDLATLRERAAAAAEEAAIAWSRAAITGEAPRSAEARATLRQSLAAAKFIACALTRRHTAIRRRWTDPRRAKIFERIDRVLNEL